MRRQKIYYEVNGQLRDTLDIRNLRDIFAKIPGLENVKVNVSLDDSTWLRWETEEEKNILESFGIETSAFTILSRDEYCELVRKLWEQYPVDNITLRDE